MTFPIVERPVPFGLREVFAEKRSGTLEVQADTMQKSLFFEQGNLIHARTNVMQERLGEILFKMGKITQEQFLGIRELLDGRKYRMGAVLVEQKYIAPDDLALALRYQIRTIALSLFSLNRGNWSFTFHLPEIPTDNRFRIGLPGIFQEGVTAMKSLVLFRSHLANLAPVVKPLSELTQSVLSPENKRFHELLSKWGQTGAADMAGKSGLDEDSFWRHLSFLYLLGAVDFIEVARSREQNRNIEELIFLYNKLTAKKSLDFYDLFQLPKAATNSEIKEKYYDYAKKFHPDRFGDAPDPDLQMKANYVFSQINKGFDVLGNENRRREYDSSLGKDMAETGAGASTPDRAAILYRKARTLVDIKRYWEAAVLLEEAVRLDNQRGSYFYLLGYTQVHIPQLRRIAERNLQKAIEMEPWNAEPYVALGILFQTENLPKRAEGFFRKALSLDANHAVAKKRLQELCPNEEKKPFFSFIKKK